MCPKVSSSNNNFPISSNIGTDPNQVAGGLKAAINNDDVPQSGKEKAQEKLDNM